MALFDPVAYRNSLLQAYSAPAVYSDAPLAPPKDISTAQEFLGGIKRSLAGVVGGAGQVGADVSGAQGNSLQQYEQSVAAANPTKIQSFGDVLEHPIDAIASATGSAVGSVASLLGSKAVGAGLIAAAPYTGAFAPLVAGAGTAVNVAGPLLTAALPSLSGIRQAQIQADPENADSFTAKLAAYPGALAVGRIELAGGGEKLASAVVDKGGAGLAASARETRRQIIARTAKESAIGEVKESIPQSIIEQAASFKNPLDVSSLQDTAFDATMSLLGGGGIGAMFGAIAPRKDATKATNDDLSRTVDDALGRNTQPVQEPTQLGFVFEEPPPPPEPPSFVREHLPEGALVGLPGVVSRRLEQAPDADSFLQGLLDAYTYATSVGSRAQWIGRARDIYSELTGGQDIGQPSLIMAPSESARGEPRAPREQFDLSLDEPVQPAPPPPKRPFAETSLPEEALKGLPATLTEQLKAAKDADTFLQILQAGYASAVKANSQAKWVGIASELYSSLTNGQDIAQPMLAPAPPPPSPPPPRVRAPGEQFDLSLDEPVQPAPPPPKRPFAETSLPEEALKGLPATLTEQLKAAKDADTFLQVLQAGYASAVKAKSQAKWVDIASELYSSLTNGQDIAQPMLAPAQNAPQPAPPTKVSPEALGAALKGVPKKVKEPIAAADTASLASVLVREFIASAESGSAAKWLWGEDGSGGKLHALYSQITGGQSLDEAAKAAQAQEAAPQQEAVPQQAAPQQEAVPQQAAPQQEAVPQQAVLQQEAVPQQAAPQQEATLSPYDAPLDGTPSAASKKLWGTAKKTRKKVEATKEQVTNIDTGQVLDLAAVVAAAKEMVSAGVPATKGRLLTAFDIGGTDAAKVLKALSKEGVLKSVVTDQSTAPRTVADVAQAIRKFLGAAAARKLQGRVVIVQTTEDLRAAMVKRGSQYAASVGDDVKGLYDPSTGTSYLVADNVGDNAVGVFLHEVGEHFGLQRMLGPEAYVATLSQALRLLQSGDTAIRRAAETVNEAEQMGLDATSATFVQDFIAAATNTPRLAQEVIAYLVENPANRQMPFVQKLIAAVKAFLVRFGAVSANVADVGTLIALTTAAARKSGEFSVRTTSPPSLPAVSNAVAVLQRAGYKVSFSGRALILRSQTGEAIDAQSLSGEIRVASETLQQFADNSPQLSYAGRKSATVDLNKLRIAQMLDRLGHDARNTWMATGFYKSPYDNAWRYEIPDGVGGFFEPFEEMAAQTKATPDVAVPLGDLISHPDLFEAYPDLADVLFVKLDMPEEDELVHGWFDHTKNMIVVSAIADDPYGVLVHEMQHWIQSKEGFAVGGSQEAVFDTLTEARQAEVQALVASRLDDISDVQFGDSRVLFRLMALPGIDQLIEQPLSFAEKLSQVKDQIRPVLKSVFGTQYLYEAPSRVTLSIRSLLMADDADAARRQLVELSDEIHRAVKDAESIRAGNVDVLKKQFIDTGLAHQYYKKIAGEIEARDVTNRLVLSAVEREVIPPMQTEYVNPEDVIVLFDKIVASNTTPQEGGDGPMFSRVTAEGTRSESTEKTLTSFGDRVAQVQASYAPTLASTVKSASVSALKQVIAWADRHHLVEMFDHLFNGALAAHTKTYDNQEVISSRFNQLFNDPYNKLERLQTTDRKRYDMFVSLMMATSMNIDPRRAWEDQPHLHDLPAAKQVEAKRYVSEYHQIWGRLTKEEKALYVDLVTMNRAVYLADAATLLYNMVKTEIPAAFPVDPFEKFRTNAATHETIEAAHDYWDGVLTSYLEMLDGYVASQQGKTETLGPIIAQMHMVRQGLARIATAPYFHMGRFGEYFVGFKVKLSEESAGAADASAMQQVSDALAQMFPDVIIRSDGTDPQVFARFESFAQAEAFQKAVQQLSKQGLLEPTEDGGTGIIIGKRSEVTNQFNKLAPRWLGRVIADIDLAGYEPEVAARLKASLQQAYLDSLPDTSVAKVLVRRKNRPGFNADMVRSYAHRMRMSTTRIASLAVALPRQAASQDMRAAIQEAQSRPDADLAEVSKMVAINDEIALRAAALDNVPDTPGLNMLRSLGHTFFLGLSPAYVLAQISQLGVLTWPELTKKYGARKSFNALVKAAPVAFRIVKTAFESGYRAAGIKGGADLILSADVLKESGVSADVAEYLVELMGTGKVDVGNASRELARIAEGEVVDAKSAKFDTIIRITTATSYGSELLTRLIAALAVRELAPAGSAIDQAAAVLDESMLNYNYTNIARMTGKSGLFGVLTPVVLQFHQFQFQVLAKLYREVYRSFGERAGVSADQVAEARSFLKAHVSTMVLLAGTMGLPFLTAATRLLDELCELFSDQPCDSRVALRNFTSDVFGADIEPIISRGILRAVGGDMSQRIGEADLIPGSQFMADRRTLAEKLKSPVVSVSGASGSMMSNIVDGAQRIADGDLLAGLQRMVPLAVQGPIKALSIADKGFVDSAGNRLPMTPHTTEVLWQLLGVQPGQMADYSEAKYAQMQRKTVIDREGAVIRKNILRAIDSQDDTALRDWVQAAKEYETDNPGRSILGGISSSVRQRSSQGAVASAFGLPLGVSPRDLLAPDSTRFFQPQIQ